jgi:hypothetical protein
MARNHAHHQEDDTMKARFILSALALAAAGSAQAQVTVFNADNGFSIDTLISDATAGLTVNKVSFDTTGTHADGSHIVIDTSFTTPTISVTGGVGSFFGGADLFGFSFAGFTGISSALFNWDPDSVGNSSFGATAADLIGMVVTAETSAGIYSGVYAAMSFGEQRGYGATLTAAVPEPSTYALMALGLAGIGFVARRRRNA